MVAMINFTVGSFLNFLALTVAPKPRLYQRRPPPKGHQKPNVEDVKSIKSAYFLRKFFLMINF